MPQKLGLWSLEPCRKCLPLILAVLCALQVLLSLRDAFQQSCRLSRCWQEAQISLLRPREAGREPDGARTPAKPSSGATGYVAWNKRDPSTAAQAARPLIGVKTLRCGQKL